MGLIVFPKYLQKKKRRKTQTRNKMITQSSAVSIHIRFFDWRGFIPRRTFSTFFHASFSSKWLERKNKTDTVSLKLPNLQCIKMFNSYSSHSIIYEKSSSKMYAIENCLPLLPPKKKVLPWGVSWELVLRWKKCVQICKANKWGVQDPGCAHERMWNWTSFYARYRFIYLFFRFNRLWKE